jgi:hypothetical protein
MHSATLCEVAFRRYFETGRFDSILISCVDLTGSGENWGFESSENVSRHLPKFGNLPAVSCCGLSCHRTSKSKRFIEARLLKTSRFAMALRFLLPKNNNSRPCASIVRAPARNSWCKVSGSWGELWNERGRARLQNGPWFYQRNRSIERPTNVLRPKTCRLVRRSFGVVTGPHWST